MQKFTTSRDGPVKIQKQGRDETQEHYPATEKIMVNKGWKYYSINLLHSLAPEVELSSSLFYHNFSVTG